jgi:integral membrane protein
MIAKRPVPPASSLIRHFRLTALAEAISWIVLLFIAMPLKYVWQMPVAVKVTGMIHGVLFVVFCFTLYRAWLAAKWPLERAVMLFIASLIPFVPFWLDQRVKTWEEAAK